jgi:hypothetical protein
MRPLSELINNEEPGWPIVQEWIDDAEVDVEVFPADAKTGEAALYALQVTTRSPMGAIAHAAAGIFVDSGWLRVLGAGGHPRFQRSMPAWNEGRGNGFLLIADDVLGGSFAINGGGLGEDKGSIYYLAPDSLQWEPLEIGYSDLLPWAMSGQLDQFYETMRWEGWQNEVKNLTADQAINVYPFLWTEGPPIAERARKAVPVAEQFALQMDMQRQLG